MKWSKGYIKELCDINPESINKNYPYDTIHYVEISSVGSGVVDLTAEISLTTAPSRAKRIVKPNDVILSIVRPGNRSFYFFKKPNENTIVSSGFAVLRPKINVVVPRFLYYLVTEPRFTAYLVAYEQGANYPSVNPDTIANKQVNYPDIATQRNIASILSAYDDLIENNIKRIKLLEEAANLRYTILVSNESNFCEYFMEEVCDSVGGGTPSTSNCEYWDDGDILWFSPTDLTKHTSFVLLGSQTMITELGLEKSSAKMVPPKSILMTSRATIGYFGLINKPVCTNQGFINIIPFKEHYRAYILFNLRSRKEEIINNANGSTFLEITKGNFRKMKIRIPQNDSVLIAFEEAFGTTFALIENLLKQNRILREARDILLPRLMSGEIEV